MTSAISLLEVSKQFTVRPTKDVIFEMVEEWIETTQRLNNLIEA